MEWKWYTIACEVRFRGGHLLMGRNVCKDLSSVSVLWTWVLRHQKPKAFLTDITIHTVNFGFGVIWVLCQTILHLDDLCVITILTDAFRCHKFLSTSYSSRFTASLPLFLSRDQYVCFSYCYSYWIRLITIRAKGKHKTCMVLVFDCFYGSIR